MRAESVCLSKQREEHALYSLELCGFRDVCAWENNLEVPPVRTLLCVVYSVEKLIIQYTRVLVVIHAHKGETRCSWKRVIEDSAVRLTLSEK